jgi:hypothetical protein
MALHDQGSAHATGAARKKMQLQQPLVALAGGETHRRRAQPRPRLGGRPLAPRARPTGSAPSHTVHILSVTSLDKEKCPSSAK